MLKKSKELIAQSQIKAVLHQSTSRHNELSVVTINIECILYTRYYIFKQKIIALLNATFYFKCISHTIIDIWNKPVALQLYAIA